MNFDDLGQIDLFDWFPWFILVVGICTFALIAWIAA